ncbi:MAG: hypothetical protein ACM3MI_15075 [Clostridiales bacterium]
MENASRKAGKEMEQVEIIIRNEKGEIIKKKTSKSYEVDLGNGSLDEIESAVEKLRQEISPHGRYGFSLLEVVAFQFVKYFSFL